MEEAAWPISTWSASQGSTGLEAYKITGEKAGLSRPRTVADSPWKPSVTPWNDLSHRQEVSPATPCTLPNTEAQKSPLQFMWLSQPTSWGRPCPPPDTSQAAKAPTGCGGKSTGLGVRWPCALSTPPPWGQPPASRADLACSLIPCCHGSPHFPTPPPASTLTRDCGLPKGFLGS